LLLKQCKYNENIKPSIPYFSGTRYLSNERSLKIGVCGFLFIMSSLPNNLKKISLFLERLPGIGEKTANRLAFYFLRLPDEDLKEFSKNIADLKTKTKFCRICFNLTENTVCAICEDLNRDKSTIAIVEDVLDLLSMEAGNQYKGVYHVLHGRIDPLNYISPEDIQIASLLNRVKKNGDKINEIILATNPNTEGEATAMYLKKQLAEILASGTIKFKVTRLAYGLPIGAYLEYADYMTLARAMEGRREF